MDKSQNITLLENVRNDDFSLVGGKGANLGEMIKAGLPVPGGFVVLTNSYKRFIEVNGLEKRIAIILESVDDSNPKELERASKTIQGLFEKGEIPQDILEEIDRNYQLMGSSEVAVRSSATAEDLPGTSFAGQYDTYLNVKGKEELYKSTKAKLDKAGAGRKAKKVEKLLTNYREVFGLREYSKYVLIKAYHIYRIIFMGIGEELVVKGRLDDKMDVFWLRFPDIMEKENLQEVAKINKEAHSRCKKLSAPRILTSTGESIYTLIEKKEDSLTGLPVSAGVYEGKVKILYSAEEGSKLEKGDVLVTRGANPAWTPLFLNIGGLVMETGGPISHGSVVAREYGVPAVVGIGNATSILKDGQIVRVNGETGTVEIID